MLWIRVTSDFHSCNVQLSFVVEHWNAPSSIQSKKNPEFQIPRIPTVPILIQILSKELLSQNTLKNFDPVKEAFRVYDPNDTGSVDMAVVQDFFQLLGFGEISEEDARLIQEMGDADLDGKIGLEDFRLMVPFGKTGLRSSPSKTKS